MPQRGRSRRVGRRERLVAVPVQGQAANASTILPSEPHREECPVPPTASPNVKFGLFSANIGPRCSGQSAASTAVLAEELGLESVWAVEHIVVPESFHSRYPYAESGRAPFAGTDFDMPDPFLWLAYAAAVTTRLNLATGVTVLPLRNPLVAAKQIATLDALSAGRVILGVGVGWLAEEFEALGVPFAGRGRRHDDYLDALRQLWSQDVATAHNGHVDFDRVLSSPKPLRRSVPVVIGGSSLRAATRAARTGDGYFPGGDLDVAGIAHRLTHISDECAVIGRDPATIEVTVYTGLTDPDALSAQIEELQAIGVSRVLLEHLPDDDLRHVVGLLTERFGPSTTA
jgi:probable F420-dependent oxidoreductase